MYLHGLSLPEQKGMEEKGIFEVGKSHFWWREVCSHCGRMKGQLNLAEMFNSNFNSFFQYFLNVCKMTLQTLVTDISPDWPVPARSSDGAKIWEHSARPEIFRPGESQNGFELERTIILKNTENFSLTILSEWSVDI